MEEIKTILTLPLWGLGAACAIGLFMGTLQFFGKLSDRLLDILGVNTLSALGDEIKVEVEKKRKPTLLDMDSLQALHWLKKHYEELYEGNGWHEGIRHNLYNGYRIHKADLFFDGKGGILTAVSATDEQVLNYFEGHQLNEGDLFTDDRSGEILVAVRATDEQLKEIGLSTKGVTEMECQQCGREFHPRKPTQKFCSTNCANVARRNETLQRNQSLAQTPPEKSLIEWVREADECHLDYGTYRALVNAGRTFAEIKAAASSYSPTNHNKSLFTSGTRGRKLI